MRTIWKLQTDVERWPSWQAPVESVERLGHGPLRRGSAFRWTLPIPPVEGLEAWLRDLKAAAETPARDLAH
ncbi:hypothetical protein [Streptomyces narbonensis]|uniref:hypothetical protein n=1 Tax=Streptomyces narbonensis TaxID=67333 RepID=UPI003F4D5EA7